jgi:acylphosphatase
MLASGDSSKEPCSRVVVIYRGNVQGVGFRYTTRATARNFAVSGTVKNLINGSVELIAEGAEPELRAFLAAVAAEREGHIREADTRWEPATGQFRGFDIAF